jgi:Mg-chelatase subunit ChlD
MRVVLPDCTDLGAEFFLTPEQRRELILLMAEKGEEGLKEFIRRHSKDDSRIAQKIERIQAKLRQEATELKRRLETEYDSKRSEEERRAARLLRTLREEEEALRSHEERLKASLPDEVSARIRSVPLIELATTQVPKAAWWRRFLYTLRRLWTRLKRWVRRLLGRQQAEPKAKGLVLGFGGAGVTLDLDIDQALAMNPAFRKSVRRSLGATPMVRARRMLRILFGLDDYADVARRVMEEQARAAAAESETANQSQREKLTAERRRLEEEEKEVSHALDEELARLRAAQAAEEKELSRVLAQQPTQDAERLVADELEAGGYVKKLGDQIEVTGRFLETLASLVYAEESKGLSASHESPLGTSVEGEGILEKTPMLSYFEASHMDVVGSLAQARMRHPKTRHILDDDVLVYREKRTSVAHVVVILDRSLSMEENERMTAAKRAALAIYWATKHKGGENKVDFVLMDTHVERASLAQCWEAKPQGFTNTGRALEVARSILENARANRKILFLVTDGLPEAVTHEGKDVAGRPEEALKYAMAQAQRLKRVKGLDFQIILLEPDDPMFLTAARKIAQEARGRVHEVKPNDLARSLLAGLQDPTAGRPTLAPPAP